MTILGIDCSASVLSVSLKVEKRLFETAVHDGFKHSENLMVQIEHLFKLSNLESRDLDLIAVAAGPGSFTGLRIAMSTAKGLALGAQCDLVSLSTLDVYASIREDFDGLVVPVIDAKKKRFYSAVYKKGNKLTSELDIEAETLLKTLDLSENILFTGPDALFFEKYKEKDNRINIDRYFSSVTATPLIKLGYEKWKEHGADPHGSGPVYIRKSEAEISMFGD
ncbi:tRNA (adenosine(37)-N6)-threonylcarbamoyltransferase complex dimerization subunit type 1 TsaB [Spirochaeta isovalerica]|uniref:tRNA threonylcarbamoyladenosine biosynthesis protein TsaB n=1 Tax=Spirochaeta isovalerica TaxID=150 RepID=A0A841R5N6_9SPIO|nr:tRNA (adenosine(37)-N6)-threonylcarbamoyltransferase complex dimerization subunit type 1 TsaB [Spirochaeta isovalerica]MBB6478691.1 tRNA threonylcarbamoyladenosine biosynthesis protein TsaB [Spirochaeta isovalerica]